VRGEATRPSVVPDPGETTAFVVIGSLPAAHRTVAPMRMDRARRRVVVVIAGVLALCWASPAAAADDPPQITEAVPIRIHGTDTNWPPVLVFLAVVVVGGGIFVGIVFMRRVREAMRADRSIR
jgi:uncharacterized integral membrane protein